MIRRIIVAGLTFVSAVWMGASAQAQDNPPTAQLPGEHSTIVTSDGTIRDDELAQMIKDAIDAAANKPTSVKVFFNSCYGGGMLDDIADMLGDYDPAIPFVGGSASSADQPAWGPSNAAVGNSSAGSYWTDALAGAMAGANQGDNVSGTLGTANGNDAAAPGGAVAGNLPVGGVPENPQNTTANGGSAVNWGPAEAVVFSGNNNRTRHDNNVSNMEDAFIDMFGSTYSSSISGSTTSDLQDMLNAAAAGLDGNEELVLYVDDHGNTEFDFDEWWDFFTSTPIVLDTTTGWNSVWDPSEGGSGQTSTLHSGWSYGLSFNVQQGDTINPGINILGNISQPYPIDSVFDLFFNGQPLTLPQQLLPGQTAFIPFGPAWPTIQTGPNVLNFVPTTTSAPPLPLINLELTSGPINDLDMEAVPEPSTLVLAALGLAGLGMVAWRRRKRG